jgi:hypothetical protein
MYKTTLFTYFLWEILYLAAKLHTRVTGMQNFCRWTGANATIVRYNASAVKIYNSTSSPVRFESKNVLSYFGKNALAWL